MNIKYNEIMSSKEFNYELYKLDWMCRHKVCLLDLIKELETLSEDFPYASLMELFEEWEITRGFGGLTYPDYNTWLKIKGYPTDTVEETEEVEKVKCSKKAIDIEWDTETREEFDALPDEIEIPDSITDMEEISDYIIEETGYYHFGFNIVNI